MPEAVVVFLARTRSERRAPDSNCVVEQEPGATLGGFFGTCQSTCPGGAVYENRLEMYCSRRSGHPGRVHLFRGYDTGFIYARWHDVE